MRRFVFLILSILTSCCAWAQWEGCYRLILTDKAGSDYCALSERAMQRRARQGIALDECDRSVSSAYLSQLRDKGWQIVSCSRWLNSVVVRRPDGLAISDAELRDLAFVSGYCGVTDPADGSVVLAAPVRGRSTTNKWNEESLLTVIGEASVSDSFRRPMEEVKGEALHEAGYCGRGMLIAVLDGGFSLLPEMPFFASKVVGWHDCYAPEDKAGEVLFASSTHGSHVLSIMATDIRDGVWGTAPEADYYVIRTEYDQSEFLLEEDMWVVGAEHADSIGADLINSSLGYNTFDNEAYNPTWDDLCHSTRHISRGAQIACQKGILVVSAAGNDRQRPWQKISFPSDVQDVFTIGATTMSLEPASFSSAGWIEPYVKPDVSCRGERSWLLNVMTGSPAVSNGTSFASPFMCGLMASLWSAVPDVTPARLMEVVRQSSSMALAPDSLMGYGLPDISCVMAELGITTDALDSCSPSEVETSCYNLWGMRVPSCSQNGCLIVQNGKKRLLLGR